jgi:DNA-binding transcriptional MerR regulator
MLPDWRTRAFSQSEAADMAGLHPTLLRQWVKRQPAVLFSERRKGRRWFSPMDIAVLAVANELSQGGMTVLASIAAAFELLQSQPEPDALIITPTGAVSHRAPRLATYITGLPEKSIQVIPAGRIVADVVAACNRLAATAAR